MRYGEYKHLLADNSEYNERDCAVLSIAARKVCCMSLKSVHPVFQILIERRDSLQLGRSGTTSIAIPISQKSVSSLENSNGGHNLTKLTKLDKCHHRYSLGVDIRIQRGSCFESKIELSDQWLLERIFVKTVRATHAQSQHTITDHTAPPQEPAATLAAISRLLWFPQLTSNRMFEG
jgi:hypothetical protein